VIVQRSEESDPVITIVEGERTKKKKNSYVVKGRKEIKIDKKEEEKSDLFPTFLSHSISYILLSLSLSVT
jgi:hypothetical protein